MFDESMVKPSAVWLMSCKFNAFVIGDARRILTVLTHEQRLEYFGCHRDLPTGG